MSKTCNKNVRVCQLNFHRSFEASCDCREFIDSNQFDFDICLIQEPSTRKGEITGLDRKRTIATQFFNLDDIRPRAAIYVSEYLSQFTSKVTNLCDKDCAVVQITLRHSNGTKRKLVFASIYMDINNNISSDFDKIIRIQNFTHSINGELFIGSDINAWHDSWGSNVDNARGKQLYRLLNAYNLTFLNTGEPTYNAGTMIDLTIIEESKNYASYWRTREHEVHSDHFLISFNIDFLKPKLRSFMNPRNTDKEKLREIVAENLIPCGKINDSIECEIAANHIADTLIKAFNESTPTTYIRGKKRDSWFNNELIELKRRYTRMSDKKRQLLDVAKDNCDPMIQDLINSCSVRKRNLHNIYRSKRKKVAKAYYQSEQNAEKTYNKAVRIFSEKNIGQRVFETMKNNSQNSSIDDAVDKIIETHFPRTKPFPGAQAFREHKGLYKKWILDLINYWNIMKAINKLGNYKMHGRDGIYPNVIKTVADLIIPNLIEIYRFSLATGYIPKRWLEVDVIFIPKPGKDDYSDPKSYRPIALLSFLIKLLEHLISIKLEEVVLEKSLKAYIRESSAEDTVRKSIANIEKRLREKDIVWALYADIRGAFDTLDHAAVKKALEIQNVEREIIDWIGTLLGKREISTEIAGVRRSFSVDKGISQGSVTACRIWNLCVNVLALVLSNIEGIVKLIFSDDLHVQVSGKDEKEIQQKMLDVLELTELWCKEFGLELQMEKCAFLRFHTFNKKNESKLLKPSIKFQGKKLKFQRTTKYLGNIIDDKLKWTDHFIELEKSIKRKLNFTFRIIDRGWGIRIHICCMILKTVILTKAFYGCTSWYVKSLKGQNRTILERIHSYSMRRLAGCFSKTSVEILETSMSILPIAMSLKIRVIMDIVRLISINKWKINKSKGLYEVNKILNISHYAGEKYDAVKGSQLTNRIKSIIPTRFDWKFSSRVEFSNLKHIYFDASVDRAKQRSGIGIYSTDLDMRHTEATSRIMSSYCAESYGAKRTLQIIDEKDIRETDLGLFCDNMTLVKTASRTDSRSRILNEICEIADRLIQKGNTISFIWIPAHLGPEERAKNVHLRKNFIADYLTHDENAPLEVWDHPMQRNELKKKLTLEMWKEAYKQYENSKLNRFKQFNMISLTRNLIRELEFGKNYLADASETRLSNFLSLSRKEFFSTITFISGQNFLRSHVSRMCKGDKLNICRKCENGVENEIHLMQECTELCWQRMLIFGKTRLNLETEKINTSKIPEFLRKAGLVEYLTRKEPRRRRTGRWSTNVLQVIDE